MFEYKIKLIMHEIVSFIYSNSEMTMERDFRYLRDKYSEAGARDVFEKICVELFQKIYENAYAVKAQPGDDGIDILVGDLTGPITVLQCKFFLDGIGTAQRKQIKESYEMVISKHQVKEWYLCVPCVFNIKEHKWWAEWKIERQELDGITIGLFEGSSLLTKLKQYEMYDELFDDDIRNALVEIEKYLLEENNRIFNEIILDINNFSDISYDDCVFVKMLESANIFDTEDFKNDFFNAEISRQKIVSKGNKDELKIYDQLKMKLYSLWNTQYRLYKDPIDGNELLAHTYMRVEDLDESTLKSIDEINLLAKKGMLHQLAEDKKIGWVEDFIEKLEKYLEK